MTCVRAKSERGKQIKITAPFENVSERNIKLKVFNTNDETRNKNPSEVNELSFPGTQFDWQPHTHHMVTRQTIETNQIVEFLTGRNLTPLDPPSHQHQNLSTQISQNNNLPILEQVRRYQNSESNNSINRLVEAIAGIATQQRLQAATMLKPVSTNTTFFDGKNEKFELLDNLFHTEFKMQPETTETMKSKHFHALLRKETLQIFRKISASNRRTPVDELMVFRRKQVEARFIRYG